MKFLIFFSLVTLSVVYADNLPCNCRLGNLNRIINGKIAAANSIPWLVSLADLEDDHFCGATIVNENYVLTAEHCTKNKHGKDITIRVGLHDTNKLEDEKIYFGKRIIHHQFKNPGDFGDFSLIEVDEPIKFIPGVIEPACLEIVDQDYEGDLLSAGWGRTARPWRDVNDKTAPLKHSRKDTSMFKYYFGTQSFEDCEDHDICTLSKTEGESICNGDSGGPLMYTGNGKTSVVGIASFVSSVEEDGKLFFCDGEVSYARVALYKDVLDKYAVNYCSA